MAHNLTKLLGDSVKARIAMSELRRMTGDDADVRLIADVVARTNTIVRSLGLDPRDVTAREIYQALMAIAPRVQEWAPFKDSHWVMADFDGQIISFHPVDIVENYHHELPLGQQRTESGKVALGHEIYRRYRQHPRTHNQTVAHVVCQGGICRLVDVAPPRD